MGRAVEQCRRVLAGEAWCAFLCGGTGNGKTHLAIASMHAYGLERSRFWKVPDWLDWVKATAKQQDWNLREVLRSYVEPHDDGGPEALIVFDDLGTENPTDFAAEQLYRVIDARCDNRLPTIVTSNVKRDRLDKRLLSRLSSGLVVCAGEDARRAK
jgi:DNA replication protein DnaC